MNNAVKTMVNSVEERKLYDLTMLYIARRMEVCRFLEQHGIYYKFDGDRKTNTLIALCNEDERFLLTQYTEQVYDNLGAGIRLYNR